jgi:hypothetical protein
MLVNHLVNYTPVNVVEGGQKQDTRRKKGFSITVMKDSNDPQRAAYASVLIVPLLLNKYNQLQVFKYYRVYSVNLPDRL